MTTYICKCGRQVKKATNADNTGNRDTKSCKGCPYLLPWGPDKYIEGQGYTKDVQGYECRMSPTISYTTTYRGQANDKCTLHILSLDLDFLDEVQAWIYDNAADTLSAGFSRGSMRGIDFSDKGRYSLSISCTQNKKGMAAKAALLERFFTNGRVRKDKTLVQEKAHILSAIKKGMEQAQGKDIIMKRQNDRCPLQQECERTCKVIGHERDCDYYVNNRYCTEGIPDQDALLVEEELRQEREREERYLSSLSAELAEPIVYQNEYGTLFAVREHKGAPSLMCKAKGADSWALSGVLAAVRGEAYTAADLQEVLDEYARAHGWEKAALEQTKEDYSPCEGCRCPDCDDEACPQAHCDKSDMGLGCIAPDGLCPPENPTDAGADAPPCAPIVSDAQTLPYPNADAGAKTGANGKVTACACYGCKRSDCTCAGGRDVFGRSDCDGHCNCSQSECTHDIRHRANPTPAAPASRADAGAAEQSLSVAGPASLEAKDMNVPTFNYSGLDDQTVADLHLAEREYMSGRKLAEVGLRRMADGVAIAHAALCGCDNLSQAHNNQHSEKTFGRWCDSVGLNRKAAERLLQVARLFDGSTPREEKVLEELGPSLLYAAAKPSAPAELVQAVKDGDITTHKQYQEALAEIRDRDAKINDLLEMSEAADRRAEKAERMRQDAQQKCEEAIAHIEVARNMQIDTARERDEARRREAKADARAREAEEENSDLRRRLQEMEERPRDVAVMQPSEDQIEAWRREGAERLTDTVKDQVSRANKEKLDAQRQVVDLQKQLAASRPDADACQRTVDILYETTENLRLLLRSQLKQAQLSPNAYGKVVAHVLQAARNLMDTVRVCSPDGYDMDSEEDDDFE